MFGSVTPCEQCVSSGLGLLCAPAGKPVTTVVRAVPGRPEGTGPCFRRTKVEIQMERSISKVMEPVGLQNWAKPLFLDPLVTRPQGLSITVIWEGEFNKKPAKLLACGSVE